MSEYIFAKVSAEEIVEEFNLDGEFLYKILEQTSLTFDTSRYSFCFPLLDSPYKKEITKFLLEVLAIVENN